MTRNWFLWLTSKDYRIHYWLRQNLNRYKLEWTLLPLLLFLFYDIEILKELRRVLSGKGSACARACRIIGAVIEKKENL